MRKPIDHAAMAKSNHTQASRDRRFAARMVLVIIYLAAGTLHLALPQPFLLITPGWLPCHEFVVAFTGACELLGAAGLLLPRFRKTAGACLALYAICVFPANVEHARLDLTVHIDGLGLWYHIPRLAFQPVLVWWAMYAGGFGAGSRAPTAEDVPELRSP